MTGTSSASSAPLATPPTRSVFGDPGFRFLLSSATISSLGGSVSSVAVSWLVYRTTGSTIDVAYVGLTGIVPGIVFGLLAGVLADRYNRRRLMVTSDMVRAVAMAGLAAALYFVGFSLLMVLGVMTVVYTFSALFTPASQAILPRMVATERLEDANGLLSASTQAASTIGAGAGGLLIVVAGAAVGLGVNAATYVLSAILLFQIAAGLGRTRDRPPGAAPSMRQEFGEGVRYMREHPAILEVTFGFLPGNFLVTMVMGFLVVYAASVLGHSAALYGYIEAAFGGATAVGALSVGRIRGRRFAGTLIGASVILQAGAIGLMVVGGSLGTALLGAGVLGLGLGLINTAYFSTMQAIVPNELLARVLSIDSVGSFVAIPAGLVVGGLLANDYGILFTYSVAGIGLLFTGIVLVALPGVRSLRYGG